MRYFPNFDRRKSYKPEMPWDIYTTREKVINVTLLLACIAVILCAGSLDKPFP
jgi:hypothetical protein